MGKMKMHTPNFTDENIAKIAELFPNCVTEVKGEEKDEGGRVKDGRSETSASIPQPSSLRQAIDFDLLKQELSADVVEGVRERYTLNWPGKNEAIATANAPINKTLRPCREESIDFDATENLYVEGDNLEALKLLQETYLGKIKMVYIDPPYNTGNDFVYSDNFTADSEEYALDAGLKDEDGNRLVNLDQYKQNTVANGRFHSVWLSMMYSRLKLSRNLMHDDGVLIVSIDENEHTNVVKLGKEVFGEENFCGEIIWKNSSKNDQSYLSIQHEYFVIFVKNKQVNKGEWTERKEGLSQIYAAFAGFKKKHGDDWASIHAEALVWYKGFPEANPISSSKHYSWMDERGVYFPDNISGPNDGQYVYDVTHPVTKQLCKQPSTGWRYPETKMEERISDNYVHFGKDHTTVPNNKTYLKNTEYQSLTSMRFVDGRSASKRLAKLFGEKVFTNPKDEFLLKDLFKAIGLNGDDIILDFFAGSGSTFHAAMELNKEQNSRCSTILVQLEEDLHAMLKTAKGSAKKVTSNAIKYLKSKGRPQVVSELGKERCRLAGLKIKEDLATTSSELDIGFRVLKIDESNMNDVYYTPDQLDQDNIDLFAEHIKGDRTAEDLLFQVMLDWGVPLSAKIEKQTIDGKTVYLVNENDLLACFDQGINEELIKKLASHKPMRAVFRDDAFESDSLKINVDQIFKVLSPGTEVKSI